MKFVGKGFQKLRPEQDWGQTHTQTDKCDRTHFHSAFPGGIYNEVL